MANLSVPCVFLPLLRANLSLPRFIFKPFLELELFELLELLEPLELLELLDEFDPLCFFPLFFE